MAENEFDVNPVDAFFSDVCTEIRSELLAADAARRRLVMREDDFTCEIRFEAVGRQEAGTVYVCPMLVVFSKKLREWWRTEHGFTEASGSILKTQAGNLTAKTGRILWNVAGSFRLDAVRSMIRLVSEDVLPVFKRTKNVGLLSEHLARTGGKWSAGGAWPMPPIDFLLARGTRVQAEAALVEYFSTRVGERIQFERFIESLRGGEGIQFRFEEFKGANAAKLAFLHDLRFSRNRGSDRDVKGL